MNYGNISVSFITILLKIIIPEAHKTLNHYIPLMFHRYLDMHYWILSAFFLFGLIVPYNSRGTECGTAGEDILTKDCVLVTVKVSFNSTIDTDQDGLLDDWERIHFGDIDQNPNNDFDGDGFSNLQEFLNGSDPKSYTLKLKPGWNLISVAGIPTEDTIESVFSEVEISPIAWTWVDGKFVPVNSVSDPLQGYWIFLHDDDADVFLNEINIREETEEYQVSLRRGWNLISIDRVPKINTIRSIFSEVNIQSPIWTWGSSHLLVNDRLDPLQGYWIYANDNNVVVPIRP